MKRVLLPLVSFAVFGLTVTSFAAIGDWKTFTNMWDVRQVVYSRGVVWAATSGGLAAFDVNQGSFELYTNTEGLSSNDVRALDVDRDGRLWLGLGDGHIDVFDPQKRSSEVITDYERRTIRTLKIQKDSLFLGLDIGVSFYQMRQRQVNETYRKLGSFQFQTPANGILIWGSDIWVATDAGVAKSNFHLVNLLAPESWTNYTTLHGLPSSRVTSLASVNGAIYAGTDNGVARFDGGRWVSIPNGWGGRLATALKEENGRLFAATSSGVLQLGDDDVWTLVGDLQDFVTSLAADDAGQIWVGRKGKGLAHFAQNAWKAELPNTPPGNSFVDLALDQQGNLWCASSPTGATGFYILNAPDQRWRDLTTEDGLPSDAAQAVAIDQLNRKWLGMWGGGLVVLDDRGPQPLMQVFNEKNGLAGSVTPTYVVVSDFALDANGVMWVGNHEANNGRALVAITPDFRFAYFSAAEGLKDTRVTDLAIDRFGRVWIATKFSGISVLDYGKDIFDKSDDDLSQGLTTDDGLLSNETRSIAIDHDDVVWIGTSRGLNFWANGKVGPPRYGTISDNINVIRVDVRNNKWIGTAAGLSILHADGFTWTHYTTQNSPLVGDNVISFAFNPKTGEAWIGTTNGLSRLETPYTQPKENLQFVKAYPNPFIPKENSRPLTITNLADKAAIKIFTANGLLVKEIRDEDIPGAEAFWDGRDAKGNFVASGVYVFIVYVEGKESKVGKMAVLRE